MTKNRITGSVDVSMTFEEIAKVNVLLERDEPKQALKHEKYDWLECPVCGGHISKTDKFCSKCGQRIDSENIAL